MNRITIISSVMVLLSVAVACAEHPVKVYVDRTLVKPVTPPDYYIKLHPERDMPSCNPSQPPCVTDATYNDIKRRLAADKDLIERYEKLINVK